MLSQFRIQIRLVLGLIVAAIGCQVVAHATYHRSGLLGTISWITFIGFWVAVVAALVVLMLLVVGLIRSRLAVRS